MARQLFTDDEIKEGKWYSRLAITIRQDARVLERKSNLTDDEVLARVPAEQKERFLKAKALHAAGAGAWRG